MPRTFLFDLGNVLFHFCHDRMCRQLGDLGGWPGDRMRSWLFASGMQCDIERGRMSDDEFHRRFQSATGRTVALVDLQHAASDIFWLNEPILPVLDALQAKGHRLVLLSNICESHFAFVRRRWDVLERFDELVLSCRVGAVKPEPGIFEAALNAIDCRPGECFYTDDIAEYVETGRRHGLDAEVFTDVPALLGHLERRSIDLW
ncbi:MAG: HAD family hydrolase [Planctomycetaceae bacterium]